MAGLRRHGNVRCQPQSWKRRRNAVVLAHNYQPPEIFHCVADVVGDSRRLAAQRR